MRCSFNLLLSTIFHYFFTGCRVILVFDYVFITSGGSEVRRVMYCGKAQSREQSMLPHDIPGKELAIGHLLS